MVSHGQFTLLLPLIKSLRNCKEIVKMFITINIPEKIQNLKWLQELPINWIYNSSQQEYVDLCRRPRKLGLNVAQSKNITIVHEAKRQSCSNINHFKFHIKSYFLNHNL